MKNAFDNFGDFLKSNPFNFPSSPVSDADELFKVQENDNTSHIDEIEKVAGRLTDEDVERIARKLAEFQKCDVGGDEV